MKEAMTYKEGFDIIWKGIWGFLDLIRGFSPYTNYRVFLYLLHAYCEGYLRFDNPSASIDESLRSSFSELGPSLPEYEMALYREFEPDILRLRDLGEKGRDSVNFLSQLSYEWYKQYQAQLFDDFLFRMSRTEGRENGEHTQPDELTNFIAELCEYDGKGKMYNPFAGSASYCIRLAGSGSFIGQELNPSVWALGALRLLAHNMDPSSFFCENSFFKWKGDEERFDLIVATPPFSLKIDYMGQKINYAEEMFLSNSLRSLTPSGKAIGVFASGITTRGGKTLELRRKLIDEDKLESVILLPPGVFQFSNIPSVILIVSNKKKEPGFVHLVDGSHFFKKEKIRTIICFDDILTAIKEKNPSYVRTVSLDGIRQNDYIISPHIFYQVSDKIPEGYVKVSMSDLTAIAGGSKCQSGEMAKVVSISALSTNPFDYNLKKESLPEDMLGPQYRKITEPVLLLSKIRTLKPSFAQASEEEPIYVHSNVLALRITSDLIRVPYLILELSKITALPTGTYIPNISQGTIMGLSILVPDLDIQEEYYNQAAKEYAEAQMSESEKKRIAEFESYKKEIRIRKHALSGKISALSSKWNLLQGFMSQNNGHLSVDDTIGKRNPVSVRLVMGQITEYMDEVLFQVDNLAEIEIDWGAPEKIFPQTFIAQYAQDHQSSRYIISVFGDNDPDSLDYDPESGEQITPSVVEHSFRFPVKALRRIFDDIFANAVAHGFIDENRLDYQIALDWSCEDDYIVMTISNNGSPLKEDAREDMVLSFGYSTSLNTDGHTGIGGHEIKSIMEKYGGKAEFISSPDDEFPVAYRLYFKDEGVLGSITID